MIPKIKEVGTQVLPLDKNNLFKIDQESLPIILVLAVPLVQEVLGVLEMLMTAVMNMATLEI